MLMCVAALMLGSVSGSPLCPSAGEDPLLWVELANDNFIVPGYDDGVTASLHGGFKVGDFNVGLGYDMITFMPWEMRSDELTGAITYDLPVDDIVLTLGIGARFSGPYGGRKVQEVVHSVTKDHLWSTTYEDSQWRPFAMGTARWISDEQDGLRFELAGTAMASYDLLTVDVTARVVVCDVVWLGPWWTTSAGTALSYPAERVRDRLDGLGFNIGCDLWGATVSLSACMAGTCYVAVGYRF